MGEGADAGGAPPPAPHYLYTQIPLLPVINKWGEGGKRFALKKKTPFFANEAPPYRGHHVSG